MKRKKIFKQKLLHMPALTLIGSVFAVILMFASAPAARAATCSPTQAFKMVVKTDNPGTSNSSSFTIPTTGGGYSYTVDINDNDNWSDVNPGSSSFNESTNRTGNVTINFGTPGTYTVSICGTFPRIFFNGGGDRQKVLAVSQWGDNAWTSMSGAFNGASNLDVTATDTPVLAGVGAVTNMFRDATSLVGNSSFSSWDVSSVAVMNQMFWGASSFNQDISSWNTSSATNMAGMLRAATAFNQDISGWNTANVTTMQDMFNAASSFNQPLNSWNTGNVTSMQSTFSGATSFNQPLSSWNTSGVTNMQSTFSGASSFNQPLNSWDTSSATTMQSMFMNATLFNQPLVGWNTENVITMIRMFNGASNYSQDISTWDTSSVTNMGNMFADASAFNQSLGLWNVSNVTNMTAMLSGTSLSTANYDSTLTGWSNQSLQSAVTLGSQGLTYCSAEADRQSIIDNFSWTIEGDSYDCTVPDSDTGGASGGSQNDALADTGVNPAVFLLAAALSVGLPSAYLVKRIIRVKW